MAGTFSKSARPALAGSYFDFLVAQPPIIAPATGSIVSLVLSASWGPLNVVTVCNSLAEYIDKFQADPNNPDSGLIAATQAFEGGGVGESGAGRVLVYRIGAAAAAKAGKTLQNTTPATAITLTAKYEGVIGNNFRVTVQDYAADVTKDTFQLLDQNGTVLETYNYANADIADLANQINLGSSWVTAVSNITGVALTYVSASAFTGGNDGRTLIAGDYTAALSKFEVQRFGVLAFENLTDSSIQASIKAWIQTQRTAGRRFFTVFGGALDETISAAITRAASFNDYDIITIGVGSVRDNNLRDQSGVPLVLSTAQLAPRIAGVIANRGERMALTFTKLAGLDLLNGASASDIVKAYDNGIIVLSRASDANATVRIEKGLTTYTTTTNPAIPRAVFSVPRFGAVMHNLQMDLTQWADENIIGSTTVNDATRTAIIGYVGALMRQRQLNGAIQPGWTVVVDPVPPPSDNDSFVAVLIGARFGRSTEQVFFTASLA